MPLCHPINWRLSNLRFCSEFILDKPQQKKFWALAETNTGFFDAEQTQKYLNIFMFVGSSINLQKKKNSSTIPEYLWDNSTLKCKYIVQGTAYTAGLSSNTVCKQTNQLCF